MTRPGLYLCGCDPDYKLKQYKNRRYDKTGVEVCPEHGERMYGWASPLTNILGRPDYSNKVSSASLQLDPDSGIRPDNRDPVLVYAMTKAMLEEDEPVANGDPDSIMKAIRVVNEQGDVLVTKHFLSDIEPENGNGQS